MGKLACLADIFCNVNKLDTRVLHKYLCTEKQDRRIQKEAGTLG